MIYPKKHRGARPGILLPSLITLSPLHLPILSPSSLNYTQRIQDINLTQRWNDPFRITPSIQQTVTEPVLTLGLTLGIQG